MRHVCNRALSSERAPWRKGCARQGRPRRPLSVAGSVAGSSVAGSERDGRETRRAAYRRIVRPRVLLEATGEVKASRAVSQRLESGPRRRNAMRSAASDPAPQVPQWSDVDPPHQRWRRRLPRKDPKHRRALLVSTSHVCDEGRSRAARVSRPTGAARVNRPAGGTLVSHPAGARLRQPFGKTPPEFSRPTDGARVSRPGRLRRSRSTPR